MTVTPETYSSEKKQMAGTMLIAEMKSLEAVRNFVEENPFWIANVVSINLRLSDACDLTGISLLQVGQGEAGNPTARTGHSPTLTTATLMLFS